LSCPEGPGLSIGAEGITIDGNSYVLDGLDPGLCEEFGIQRSGIYNPGHDHVEILDLEVKNFCNGIYLRGGEITGDFVFNNTVKNCDIHHNGNDIGETATHGIKLKYVSHSRISNNRVHHNMGKGDSCEGGGNGIFIYGGEYNTLFDNMVYDNTKAGIFTKMKSRSNNISSNEVKGNGQGGILLRCKCSSSSNIEHNIAMDNKGPGIYVGGPDNTLRFNKVTNNRNGSAYRNDASVANGIRVSREAHNTTLIANDVTANDEVDIYAREELTVTGYNNTYQTFLNYEDDRLSLTGEEEVEGKRMVVRAETIELKKQGIELPPVKATPLIATLIVLIVLAFMVYGYSRRNT
jgi:parallel beta-helix repeat protein